MINRVTLIGNVGQDPDIRTLQNGTQVGRFSLATSESYKDKEGVWQKQTEWHSIIVWRELAERAASQVKKGGLLFVEGKIQANKFTDKDGVEKTRTDIVCSTFRILEKKEPSTQEQPTQSAQQNGQAPQAQPASGNPDDLPF